MMRIWNWCRCKICSDFAKTIAIIMLFGYMFILTGEALLEIEEFKFQRDFGVVVDGFTIEENRIRVIEAMRRK